MRSVMSETVRGVREERDGSSVRSFWIRVMHFFSGMDGKSASASKDTREFSLSLVVCVSLFWFLTQS